MLQLEEGQLTFKVKLYCLLLVPVIRIYYGNASDEHMWMVMKAKSTFLVIELLVDWRRVLTLFFHLRATCLYVCTLPAVANVILLWKRQLDIKLEKGRKV